MSIANLINRLRLRFQRYPPAEQLLLLSCFFSLLLMTARISYTGSVYYLFLVWNLFLAFVPYRITVMLRRNIQGLEQRWRFGLVAVVWLLFIPNAFYIITDLFHLAPNTRVPYWFDLILLMSFAWNGILLGVLSVRHMEQLFRLVFDIRHEGVFLYPVLLLNGLGVYVGRYLRFNSWDILTNPFALASDIGYLLIHPLRNSSAWAMVLCFSMLMYFLYQGIKMFSQSFHQPL